MALVTVSANDIDNAGVAVDAELPVAWLDAELADAQASAGTAGRLSARLSRSGNDIVVRGRVVAAVSLPCARCLDPAPVEVDTELSLLLKPAPVAHGKKAAAREAQKAAARESQKGGAGPAASSPRRGRGGRNGSGDALDEYEFSSAEADTDTFDGETVVLDPFIREAILLELPNFPLCSEECAGIRAPAAPALGRSGGKPVDPRLAPLIPVAAALRAKLASTSGDTAASDEAGVSVAGASTDRGRQPAQRSAPQPPKPRSKHGPKLKANAAPRPKKKRK